MKLLKKIVKYGLFIGTLGFSSYLNFGENLKDIYTQKNIGNLPVSEVNLRDVYAQEAIEKLPLSEINMVHKMDVDVDNNDDYIVIGKLFDNHRDNNGKFVGKDKCGIFFLKNENKKFKVHTLEERLDRYPELLNSWISTINGQNIKISIDNLVKNRKKIVLTLETGGKKHKAYLDKSR
ncbi:MAG: hypothetical protein L6266_06240 [Nanoarchaeota archaeon]|nr:hypothetical protein [Nanoarchaeota archaeon]